MKLTVKNKFISLGGSSKVTDENEQPVLFVKGKIICFGKKKIVQDLEGNTLYKVRNQLITFFIRRAFIYDKDNNLIATVTKRFRIKEAFDIEGTEKPLSIEGNYWGWNFNIVYGGELIGTISRKLRLTDCFEVDVAREEDSAFLVAIVIALDNIYDKKWVQAD